MSLAAYLDSIRARDPAPRSRLEVLTYPGVWALAWHRIAHRLYGARLFLLARVVNHLSRAATGIDIHPGAAIGRRFFVDHGFGVVIGETAVIGDDVTIYQNATLGGTNPVNGIGGRRHPTILSGAVIGSGAQVLGPITVGEGARIGANAVVTRDVAPGATMVGVAARPTPVDAAEATRFTPYGACGRLPDAAPRTIEALAREIERLSARIDDLMRERDAAPAGRERA